MKRIVHNRANLILATWRHKISIKSESEPKQTKRVQNKVFRHAQVICPIALWTETIHILYPFCKLGQKDALWRLQRIVPFR